MKLKIILVLSFLVMKIFNVTAQNNSATLSGLIKNKTSKAPLPYVNIVLKSAKDQKFLFGTVTAEDGRFNLATVPSGNFLLEITATGYKLKLQKVFVGTLSDFLDLNTIDLEEDINALSEVVVTSKTSEISAKMDKKVFSVAENITQSGSSVLQSMQSLPGVTINDGKVQLRGNDKVMVLMENRLL